MSKYVNAEIVDIDLSMIDWMSILDELKKIVDVRVIDFKFTESYMAETSNSSKHLEQMEILNLWEKFELKKDNIRWYNYFPNDHYPSGYIEKIICEKLNVNYRRSWFSRLEPGDYTAWHWDLEPDDYDESTAERYSIFLGGPKLGHIFIIGKDDYFYNMEHGTVIKWKNHKEWHVGGNIGLESKWMFHFMCNRLGNEL
jgi:hypothetical protein